MSVKTNVVATNAKSLNKSLLEIFNGVNMETIGLDKAKELANVSGKIIKLNLGRLEYRKMSDSKDEIDFWKE